LALNGNAYLVDVLVPIVFLLACHLVGGSGYEPAPWSCASRIRG
jgi:hypothetical protein